MSDKIRENLKTYTYAELREMITKINDEVAIKGMSKIKTKKALVDFIMAKHSHHFKKLASKKDIKESFTNIRTVEEGNAKAEIRKKAAPINQRVIDKVLKTKNDKDLKKMLIKDFISTGEPLPAKASQRVKDIYKKAKAEYVKKLKAKNKKAKESK